MLIKKKKTDWSFAMDVFLEIENKLNHNNWRIRLAILIADASHLKIIDSIWNHLKAQYN